MTDTINLTTLLAGANLTSNLERTNNSEQAEDVARPGRRRGQLRAAFARERERPRPAFMLELSQRARQTAETRETETAAERERAAEAAPRGRAALGQQFRQQMQAFGETNQPGQAGGGGEERRGVVTIPVGLERGAQQGGGAAAGAAAAPAAARTLERPESQAGAQPEIITNREPPQLDGVRMAASFEFTALGNALRMNRGPANVATRPAANAANQGLAVGRDATPTTRPGTMGEPLLAAGGNTTPGRQNFDAGAAALRQGNTGGNQLAQGPLSRVERRQENPGNDLLNADQRSPLGADRIGPAQGRIGNAQLEQRPVVGRVNPGGPEEADNAMRAGAGTEYIDRATGQTGQANGPGNNPNANTRLLNTGEQPPARANAGLRQDNRTGGGTVGSAQAPAPPQQAVAAMGANRLAGAAAEEPGGRIGEGIRPNAVPTPGVAPPANPLAPEEPNLIRNEPAAPLDGNPGQVVPRPADVQGAVATEPEQPAANPAPAAPEPPETPTEQAAAIRSTPAETADAELRATIPTPIEPPPGAAARETPAAPPGPAEANPAAGLAGQVGGPVGAAEMPPAPAAGLPAEAGAAEENGPEATPPVAAAEGRPPRAGALEGPANERTTAAAPRAGVVPAERPPTGEEGGLEARATAAYEQQQMENRTNEPNEGRTVTELFIR